MPTSPRYMFPLPIYPPYGIHELCGGGKAIPNGRRNHARDIFTELTGDGRWSRDAASFSPGASNATTGTPKVAPNSEVREPPNECPTICHVYK